MPRQSIDNRFLPDGYRYGYPITMFNRNEPNWSLEESLRKIRGRIRQGFDHRNDTFDMLSPEGKTARMYFKIYKAIYEHASKPKPKSHKDSDDDGVDVVAYWTETNAFVRMVGLAVSDRVYMLSPGELAQKVTNCETGFDHMDYELKDYKNDDIKYRSKELIMYLQAYDLLKGAGVYMQDDDGNSPCSIRGRLRQYMFFYSKKVDGRLGVIKHVTGHKKNYGLMAAGALGLGAVVLSDAGAKRYWLNKHWTPRYWSEYAKEGIEDNLFSGKHVWPAEDVPQSERGKLTGYAEGMGYFNCAFENLIPFFRASSNFASPGSGEYPITI